MIILFFMEKLPPLQLHPQKETLMHSWVRLIDKLISCNQCFAYELGLRLTIHHNYCHSVWPQCREKWPRICQNLHVHKMHFIKARCHFQEELSAGTVEDRSHHLAGGVCTTLDSTGLCYEVDIWISLTNSNVCKMKLSTRCWVVVAFDFSSERNKRWPIQSFLLKWLNRSTFVPFLITIKFYDENAGLFWLFGAIPSETHSNA